MKKLFLILPLAVGIYAIQGWAPPPGKGGATGGQDISKCDLKPKEQTKVKIKDKGGKTHYICTGIAICGGKMETISCKVSEKEPCPIAKKCLSYDGEFEIDYILKYTKKDYSKIEKNGWLILEGNVLVPGKNALTIDDFTRGCKANPSRGISCSGRCGTRACEPVINGGIIMCICPNPRSCYMRAHDQKCNHRADCGIVPGSRCKPTGIRGIECGCSGSKCKK